MHRERELRRAQAKMRDLAAHLDQLTSSTSVPVSVPTTATTSTATAPPPSVDGAPLATAQARQVAVSGPAVRSGHNREAGMQTPLQQEGSTVGHSSSLRPRSTAPSSTGIGRGRLTPGVGGSTSLPGGPSSLSSLRGRSTAAGTAPPPIFSHGASGGTEHAGVLRGARHLYRGYLAGLESDTTVDSDVGY
jgi:hypothetical protein